MKNKKICCIVFLYLIHQSVLASLQSPKFNTDSLKINRFNFYYHNNKNYNTYYWGIPIVLNPENEIPNQVTFYKSNYTKPKEDYLKKAKTNKIVHNTLFYIGVAFILGGFINLAFEDKKTFTYGIVSAGLAIVGVCFAIFSIPFKLFEKSNLRKANKP